MIDSLEVVVLSVMMLRFVSVMKRCDVDSIVIILLLLFVLFNIIDDDNDDDDDDDDISLVITLLISIDF
jgi:hypothetical protein